MMSVDTRRAALLVVATLCLASLAARAADEPPVDTLKGYGPARFGTRWEKARALFPGGDELPANKNVGAPSVGGPFVHRLYLTDQRAEGLPKPVSVELRFWKKRLWVVQVYWGDNAEQEVLAMLGRRLGPPSGSSGGGGGLWTTDAVQTTVTPQQRTYGTADLQLSADAQRWFKRVMKGEWQQPSQAELDEMEGRAPAPTPAP